MESVGQGHTRLRAYPKGRSFGRVAPAGRATIDGDPARPFIAQALLQLLAKLDTVARAELAKLDCSWQRAPQPSRDTAPCAR